MGCTPILHYLKALWIFQAKLKPCPWNKVSHFNPFLVLKMFSRPRRMLHVNDPIKWTMSYEWRRRQRDTVAMSCQVRLEPTRRDTKFRLSDPSPLSIEQLEFFSGAESTLSWCEPQRTPRNQGTNETLFSKQSRRDIHSNCRVALLNFGWPFYISQICSQTLESLWH